MCLDWALVCVCSLPPPSSASPRTRFAPRRLGYRTQDFRTLTILWTECTMKSRWLVFSTGYSSESLKITCVALWCRIVHNIGRLGLAACPRVHGVVFLNLQLVVNSLNQLDIFTTKPSCTSSSLGLGRTSFRRHAYKTPPCASWR